MMDELKTDSYPVRMTFLILTSQSFIKPVDALRFKRNIYDTIVGNNSGVGVKLLELGKEFPGINCIVPGKNIVVFHECDNKKIEEIYEVLNSENNDVDFFHIGGICTKVKKIRKVPTFKSLAVK